MDATLQSLYNLLPAQFRPYIVIALILAYAITKWRSNTKSAQLKTQKLMPDGKPGFFSHIVDIMF